MTQEEFERTEELILLKDCRVVEDGKKTAVFKKKGSTVKVSGVDKVQLLSTKMAEVKPVAKNNAASDNK